ncbi:MAG: ABC transporter ATP-binding protein [Oscillospiraceae bacterium]|jgi:iron complex transport system ATP-binding protein|nr:ABC transporter ATP-binding protein [Oscillospiraceae bacterium]
MDNHSIGLCAEHLSFSYVKECSVINNISFSISAGKITALIGPNGCGKSTLFSLLTGKLKPDAGNIILDGQNISDIKRRDIARRVSVVHQQNTAPNDITVRRLVAMGRTPYQTLFSSAQNKNDSDAVERALQITNTEKHADRMISTLSGGQRQRVWLAMALAQATDILLLDEVTAYLDIYYQLSILKLVQNLNREYGMTIVLVMHDVNQALTYSDEVMVMQKGEMAAFGKTSEIITPERIRDAFRVNSRIKSCDGKPFCFFTD